MTAGREKLREALVVVGEFAHPRGGWQAEDPEEWAVAIVGAATNSESLGDAAAQDRLIEAIGVIIGAEPGQDGHGLTLDQMAERLLSVRGAN